MVHGSSNCSGVFIKRLSGSHNLIEELSIGPIASIAFFHDQSNECFDAITKETRQQFFYNFNNCHTRSNLSRPRDKVSHLPNH